MGCPQGREGATPAGAPLEGGPVAEIADAPLFNRFRDSHGAKIGTWASLEWPPASDAGERWFKSSRPDCKKACHTRRRGPYMTLGQAKRKGKPTGDGTRLLPG